MNKFNFLILISILSLSTLFGQSVRVKVTGEKYVEVANMEVLISLAEMSAAYPQNPSNESENGIVSESDFVELLNLHQFQYAVFNESEISISKKAVKIISWSINLSNKKHASIIEDFVSTKSNMKIRIVDFELKDISSRVNLYKDLIIKARQRADLIALASNQKIESIESIFEVENEFSNLAITTTMNVNEIVTWGYLQKPSLDFGSQLISGNLEVRFK